MSEDWRAADGFEILLRFRVNKRAQVRVVCPLYADKILEVACVLDRRIQHPAELLPQAAELAERTGIENMGFSAQILGILGDTNFCSHSLCKIVERSACANQGPSVRTQCIGQVVDAVFNGLGNGYEAQSSLIQSND